MCLSIYMNDKSHGYDQEGKLKDMDVGGREGERGEKTLREQRGVVVEVW